MAFGQQDHTLMRIWWGGDTCCVNHPYLSPEAIDSVTFDVGPDTTWMITWITDPVVGAYGGPWSTADIDSITYEVNIISSTSGGGVVDIDGNSYSSIELGNGQEWMAENLRTSRYANGDFIPNLIDE